MKKYFLFVFVFISNASSAWAGSQVGQVTKILVRASDGLTYVFLSGNSNSKPACAKYTYWMIRDENSAAGKKQLALLMMAQASNRTVAITGAGTCARWTDGEDIEGLEVMNTTASP